MSELKADEEISKSMDEVLTTGRIGALLTEFSKSEQSAAKDSEKPGNYRDSKCSMCRGCKKIKS
jgi:hypothetical protein